LRSQRVDPCIRQWWMSFAWSGCLLGNTIHVMQVKSTVVGLKLS
jgi:hypothetical protein